MQGDGCLLRECSNFYYQFTLKDMIYLLIFIVLIVGVLLHSLTSSDTGDTGDTRSSVDDDDFMNQVMSSDSGE